MNHSTKSTTAVVTSVVGVLLAASAALAITQLVEDPKVDPAPSTTGITGPLPQGPGHVIDPDAGRPFNVDPAPPTARVTGPPPQGPGHVIDPDTGRPFSPVDDPPTN